MFFLHKLGLACGEWDISKLESLTPTALAYWYAFYKLNPFGEEIQDMRFQTIRADMATNSQAVRNMFAKGRASKKHKPSDFPIFDRHSGKKARRRLCDMTPEEINEAMRATYKKL